MKQMSIQIPLIFLPIALSWSTAVAGLAFGTNLERVRSEIAGDGVFNRWTCAAYLDRGTHFLYQHGTRTHVPESEAECALLHRRAPTPIGRLA